MAVSSTDGVLTMEGELANLGRREEDRARTRRVGAGVVLNLIAIAAITVAGLTLVPRVLG
jgi:hypothetical protein